MISFNAGSLLVTEIDLADSYQKKSCAASRRNDFRLIFATSTYYFFHYFHGIC
jgi:hypothetical protein